MRMGANYMSKKFLPTSILCLLLIGCAGLRQFPNAPDESFETSLNILDASYEAAIKKAYAAGITEKSQIAVRNGMIEQRMAVIDAYFKKFVRQMAHESATIDFGIGLFGIGVGGAGALVPETASQILSAVSAGLTGGQAAYAKSVLYEKSLMALIAQMHAGRRRIAAQIHQRWSESFNTYPLWLARRDLDAYQFAGSIPGAIVSTAAAAKDIEDKANETLLSTITPASVTEAAFARRAKLGAQLNGLGAVSAKALIDKIFAAYPKAATIFAPQYPAATRLADTNGKGARTVLHRLMITTAKSNEDMDKWQAAIDGL